MLFFLLYCILFQLLNCSSLNPQNVGIFNLILIIAREGSWDVSIWLLRVLRC